MLRSISVLSLSLAVACTTAAVHVERVHGEARIIRVRAPSVPGPGPGEGFTRRVASRSDGLPAGFVEVVDVRTERRVADARVSDALPVGLSLLVLAVPVGLLGLLVLSLEGVE